MSSLRALLVAAVLGAGASVGGLPAYAQAQAVPAPAPNTVVATVNGSPILYADLNDAYQRLPEQYRQIPLEIIYSTLLEQLIRGKLMVVEGRRLGMQADPEVKKRLLAAEDLAIQLVYTQHFIDTQINDAAMQKRYAEMVAALPPQEEVRARHILVKTEAEAVKIIGELKKGADFADMARLYSTDGAAAAGGDLGYFRNDEMIEVFANAAFAMRKGETGVAPVQTEFGFHVIKVEDRRPAAPPSLEELKDGIRQELSNTALASHVGALGATAVIQRFNSDGTPLAAPAAPPPAERR
ncbi:MAG: peptidylprolyl isomerase [Alphaproteobacteria bacterium]|nr:peptidylprolyl isomerase [Alphaproteobacteria bacterium]